MDPGENIDQVASLTTTVLDVTSMLEQLKGSGTQYAAISWASSVFSTLIKKHFTAIFLSSFAPAVC